MGPDLGSGHLLQGVETMVGYIENLSKDLILLKLAGWPPRKGMWI